MMTASWAALTIIALAAVVLFTTLGAVFVIRRVRRPALPISDEIGGISTVVRKLRKGEPMTEEEVEAARRAISDRSSPLAFCIPAGLLSLGCFYVFGSLEHLHGATPSERTFLGVFPMLTATNFIIQLLRSASLKRRLRNKSQPPKPVPQTSQHEP
ncbi:hypothetical protein [Mycolicibacterium chlorophenolicum]|uniref:Uncharacterized protein n=1 Tax=Mycolicibacterium chlorophenolicum TaxID=37916 RepID=A0A0J6WNJ9_9MYCO|nr:hypothetical protein [Mycolicibacterium chlorophenolicum]KMO83658.1 hypothetical protein MCHLDSM_00310 [Mycolicibacterium chlorophenolicum]